MGSLRRPDFYQWKSLIYLVILAVIFLAGATTTSPVSRISGHNWQQVKPETHTISKRATRSESLQKLRSLLQLKRQIPSSSQSEEDKQLQILRDLTSFTDDIVQPQSFDLEDYSQFGSIPFNGARLDSYSNSYLDSQQLPSSSSSSSSPSSSSYEHEMPQQPEVKRSYTNRWWRSRLRSRSNRSRYNYIKRHRPCYLNVVTCF